jgi:putative oxidoreductase
VALLRGRRIQWAVGATIRTFFSMRKAMKLPDSFVAAWEPKALALLRIVAGFMFMLHGTQKHLGFPVARPNSVDVLSLPGIAGVMEIVGGALLIIGLFTRPVAFLLSGLMAFAYFLAHAPQGFWPIVNRGELAALYSFVFLYFAVAGAGEWSLDRWLGMRRWNERFAS